MSVWFISEEIGGSDYFWKTSQLFSYSSSLPVMSCLCFLSAKCRPLGRYVGVCHTDLICNGDYQLTNLPTYQRSNLPAILTKHSGDGVIIDLMLRTFSTFSQIILCGQFLVTLHRETPLENYKGKIDVYTIY